MASAVNLAGTPREPAPASPRPLRNRHRVDFVTVEDFTASGAGVRPTHDKQVWNAGSPCATGAHRGSWNGRRRAVNVPLPSPVPPCSIGGHFSAFAAGVVSPPFAVGHRTIVDRSHSARRRLQAELAFRSLGSIQGRTGRRAARVSPFMWSPLPQGKPFPAHRTREGVSSLHCGKVAQGQQV